MTSYIKTTDGRLNSDNYLFEMTIDDYYELIKSRLKDNRYQRKRVRNSSSVYNLLKKDLCAGCLMPPIVLAYEGRIDEGNDIVDQLMTSSETILILDGLQRSYTIKDLVEELGPSLFDNQYEPIKNNKIRVELYCGIKRSDLLYRMLTLNTGQTRMSTRHQIEIIYSDYLDFENTGNIKLLTLKDSQTPSNIGEYAFRDAIEGFTSYLTADYLLLDRLDILENVKELERLTNLQSEDKDMFLDFLETYTFLINVIHSQVGNKLDDLLKIREDDDDDMEESSFVPFGRDAIKIFSKSQALTGFGSAVAKLMERKDIKSFSSIRTLTETINKDTMTDGLLEIVDNLQQIKPKAKKIGNEQRYYFLALFMTLFDSENQNRDLLDAAKNAKRKYNHEFSY